MGAPDLRESETSLVVSPTMMWSTLAAMCRPTIVDGGEGVKIASLFSACNSWHKIWYHILDSTLESRYRMVDKDGTIVVCVATSSL